ncbi:MAG: 16S rRNA (cytosine(1402)-N(4))-methyltransferase RsmH [Myxococcota bacterium]
MEQDTTAFAHTAVLLRQTLEALGPRAGGVYADATVGGGGHAEAILEASAPNGRLIGVDRDPAALDAARARLARFGDRARLVHAEFAELARVLSEAGVGRVNGLVADLGVSSPQLEQPERGFSFGRSGPLDMRMDPSRGESAAQLVARLSERELADVIFQLGEERRSRAVARAIKAAVERGEMETTDDLRRAVVRAVGPRKGRIDPATRTFQALRMAVNAEVEQLEALLRDVPELLEDGGVAAIISFHSLEDRRVKHAFRDDRRLAPLTKKPIAPSDEERRANPRARSAKLRAARRLPRGAEVTP